MNFLMQKSKLLERVLQKSAEVQKLISFRTQSVIRLASLLIIPKKIKLLHHISGDMRRLSEMHVKHEKKARMLSRKLSPAERENSATIFCLRNQGT